MKYIPGVYIAEIADSSSRRILSPFHTVGCSIGFLLGYTTSAFVPWRTCKIILGSVVTIPAAFLILLIHESPDWLVNKGCLDKAK